MRKAWQLSYNGVRTMLNVNTEAAAAHNAARLDQHLHHEIELNNHANRCVKSAIIEKILDDLIDKIEFQFSSVSILLGLALHLYLLLEKRK